VGEDAGQRGVDYGSKARPGGGPRLGRAAHSRRRAADGRRRCPEVALIAAAAAIGFVLLAVAVRSDSSIWPGDVVLHRLLASNRREWLTAAALAITATGATNVVFPLLAVATVLLTRGRLIRRVVRVSAACGVLLAGVGVRLAISDMVARPRPPDEDWAGYAAGYAYPSGHTTAAAITAGLIAWLAIARFRQRTRFWIVLGVISWAAAVGLTRAYLGVHWPTDVVGGWLLAVSWVCGCAAVAAGGLRGRPGSAGVAEDDSEVHSWHRDDAARTSTDVGSGRDGGPRPGGPCITPRPK